MNRYPLQARPGRWEARLTPVLVRLFRSVRLRRQRLEHQLVDVDVRNAGSVRAALERGDGVLITPNHPGHADAYVLCRAADFVGTPFHYMSAWQIFTAQSWIGRWSLQVHGCFSIDREGADRHAFKTAVQILQQRPQPLVIFAEGDVYHQNDRVTPFREGAAAIALTAAKRADRPVVCIPCGLKYRYVEDPLPALLALMDKLEERILWRPRRDLPLRDRIYRFADGLLAIKEIEYLGAASSGGLPQRIETLADTIMRQLEARYDIRAAQTDKADGRDPECPTLPERVKDVRRAALDRLDRIESGAAKEDDRDAPMSNEEASDKVDAAEAEAIARDLDDVFLVVQLFSYPGDYLEQPPSIERLAETLDKFEEDVLSAPTATVRAARRAVVAFGEPVVIPGGRKAAGGGSGPGDRPGAKRKLSAAQLTHRLEQDVQRLLDSIQ